VLDRSRLRQKADLVKPCQLPLGLGTFLRRRARRQPGCGRASILHRLHGGDAYYLARERARRPDGRRITFWTKIAIEIARL
jgi:hypothetical protein